MLSTKSRRCGLRKMRGQMAPALPRVQAKAPALFRGWRLLYGLRRRGAATVKPAY